MSRRRSITLYERNCPISLGTERQTVVLVFADVYKYVHAHAHARTAAVTLRHFITPVFQNASYDRGGNLNFLTRSTSGLENNGTKIATRTNIYEEIAGSSFFSRSFPPFVRRYVIRGTKLIPRCVQVPAIANWRGMTEVADSDRAERARRSSARSELPSANVRRTEINWPRCGDPTISATGATGSSNNSLCKCPANAKHRADASFVTLSLRNTSRSGKARCRKHASWRP